MKKAMEGLNMGVESVKLWIVDQKDEDDQVARPTLQAEENRRSCHLVVISDGDFFFFFGCPDHRGQDEGGSR